MPKSLKDISISEMVQSIDEEIGVINKQVMAEKAKAEED